MWIRVKTPDGPRFSIPVPLSLAGSRLLWKFAAKHAGPDAANMMQFAPEMIKALRSYARKHDHFCLVDVSTHEGDHVRITV